MKKKIKRLYFDIETSPNIVFSWNVGYNLNIDYNNILKERAIICVCYKWEGEKKVNSFKWNKGDDKNLLENFIKVIHSADEVVGHNGDKFDIKWLRTRCIYHGVDIMSKFHTIDTLKLARKGFKFNSNRLDYIAKFLKIGSKINTNFDLWKNIVLDNDVFSMNKMVEYCKKDVLLLEKVYKKFEKYVEPKSHIGVLNGKTRASCPSCGSENTHVSSTRILTSGLKNKNIQCKDCCKYFTLSESIYLKSKELKK